MRTKRIRIGSHMWKLRYKDKVIDDDGALLNGVTHEDDRLIEIDRTIPADNQGLILFHECIHAALFETGLNELMDAKFEEALVRGLSNTLWPLVRDNKLIK